MVEDSQQIFTLRKRFTFEAAHYLPGHDGKCRRLHGHSWVGWVNVSPKLSSSGNVPSRSINPAALRALQASGKAVWKFVAADSGDLREVADLVSHYGLAPIYIMPLGVTSEAVISVAQALSTEILDRGWNLTLRMHVILYGNKRGI